MSRATLVYIVMLVACAAGLWLILRAGSGMRAPVDLSGVWGVGGEDPTVAEHLGDTVAIEQSGRFFRLNFQHGLRVDVKLVDETAPDAGAGRKLDMLFEGPRWKLSAFGNSTDGPLIFRLTGPEEKHTFTVARGNGKGEAGADDDAAGEDDDDAADPEDDAEQAAATVPPSQPSAGKAPGVASPSTALSAAAVTSRSRAPRPASRARASSPSASPAAAVTADVGSADAP